jgi:hypothetical protein
MTTLIPDLHRHTEASTLQLALVNGQAFIAQHETGDDVRATGDRRQAHVGFHIPVDIPKALLGQR